MEWLKVKDSKHLIPQAGKIGLVEVVVRRVPERGGYRPKFTAVPVFDLDGNLESWLRSASHLSSPDAPDGVFAPVYDDDTFIVLKEDNSDLPELDQTKNLWESEYLARMEDKTFTEL